MSCVKEQGVEQRKEEGGSKGHTTISRSAHRSHLYHLVTPMSHLHHDRVVGVDGVTTATPVDQLRGLRGVRHVVRAALNATEGDGVGVLVVRLHRVVVHDIKQHFDAGAVQPGGREGEREGGRKVR